jgi:predicted nucleic acid-binding protein
MRPQSLPARVLFLVVTRQVTLALDERVFGEYQESLRRSEFGFDAELVEDVLDHVWLSSEWVQARALGIRLPDPDDAMFIEVAVTAGVNALVTGNRRHFPAAQCQGVRIMSPRQFLDHWAGARS